MANTERKNDFSKGSIASSIMNLAVPMTLAQLINVTYSIVDRMYLGQAAETGHLALTGIGLSLPIISILMGVASLCGTGGAPLCSIKRGEGDEPEAERIMGNAFALLLIFGVALTVVIIIFLKPLLYLFGASDVTYPYASAYLRVYMCGTIFVMIGFGMNPFINSQGFGKTGMLTVALGAVVNIVLDPIFIFVFDMGITGAALATIVAQGCSAVWVLFFLTGKKTILRLRLKSMKLEARRVKNIISLGLSGLFMNLTNSLVQVVCNTTLQKYGGDLYVGVMAVINSVREVVFMPIGGLNNGTSPVIGFNYGAGEFERVRKSIRFSSTATIAYAAFISAVIVIFPGFFFRIFTSEQELISAGVSAIRIYFCLFAFQSLQMSSQVVFVGLGRSKYAVFFSLLRKAFIAAPLTILLPFLGMGTQGVFAAEAASHVIGGVACFTVMYLTVYRKMGKLAGEKALQTADTLID